MARIADEVADDAVKLFGVGADGQVIGDVGAEADISVADGKADLQIELTGAMNLQSSDFVL